MISVFRLSQDPSEVAPDHYIFATKAAADAKLRELRLQHVLNEYQDYDDKWWREDPNAFVESDYSSGDEHAADDGDSMSETERDIERGRRREERAAKRKEAEIKKLGIDVVWYACCISFFVSLTLL